MISGLANICGQILAAPWSRPSVWAGLAGDLPINADRHRRIHRRAAVSRRLQPEHAQRLDIGGVILLSLTLGLLVYPLIEGRESGWPIWVIAMLLASPLLLAAFVRFEARLSARGGDPLIALHLLRNSDFVIGLVMALAFYMLSSFYLTFAVYLQSGLHQSPLAAGLATLPFATGFFVSSLLSSYVMQWLGSADR